MTKEELIKDQFPNDEFLQSGVLQIVDKCTADLEKENAEFKEQLYAFDEEREKLRKENADLKEELKKWKDEWQEQVQKATDEGYARTLQTMQLSKAKELLNEFLDFEASCMERGIYISDKTRAEAEQFLNSEVGK